MQVSGQEITWPLEACAARHPDVEYRDCKFDEIKFDLLTTHLHILTRSKTFPVTVAYTPRYMVIWYHLNMHVHIYIDDALGVCMQPCSTITNSARLV